MQIYMIQEITEGIAECPKVFTDEVTADNYYIKLVNEVFEKNFTNEKDASDFLRETCDLTEINYWVNEIKVR